MMKYKLRKDTDVYGFSIGILHVPCAIPLIPGDVGNASTFSYPVLHSTLNGCTTERILDMNDKDLEKLVIQSALKLERQGVHAISSDCGLMVRFQKPVSNSVKVPVLLSSLLLIPLISSILGVKGVLAIIAADKSAVSPELLELAGLEINHRVVVHGLDGVASFRRAILEGSGELDPRAIERDLINDLGLLIQSEPDISAFLFECVDLPPYSHAINIATGLPVFDAVTMIDYLYWCTHPPRYEGDY